ncbi:hypothetical protein [Chryseobacterium gallinarum]|uniref:Uncharacterized protein n=1 Tax=Chryseobacterium gallinarum TaxID=1324352 RepID=A0ABX6KVC9_CHRGL|nr:hypothetical protein [Chryseobacterium gallinarum]QIY92223.1 hypothetical protein FOB44_16825 [Chryseobacterium gallinarum]
MNKDEKIQEAYGEYYLKHNIDENGWTNSPSQGFINSIPCDAKEMHIVYGKPEWWYRPKSLSGLENNNGWIKIESEKDLPNEEIGCWFLDKNDGAILGRFLPENKDGSIQFILDNATHYQPIEKPKLPIY